jgi:hypothetical protein
VQNKPDRRSLASILVSPSNSCKCTSSLVIAKLDGRSLVKGSITLLSNFGQCPALAGISLFAHHVFDELADGHRRAHMERLALEILVGTFPDLDFADDVDAGAFLGVNVLHAWKRSIWLGCGLDLCLLG